MATYKIRKEYVDNGVSPYIFTTDSKPCMKLPEDYLKGSFELITTYHSERDRSYDILALEANDGTIFQLLRGDVYEIIMPSERKKLCPYCCKSGIVIQGELKRMRGYVFHEITCPNCKKKWYEQSVYQARELIK